MRRRESWYILNLGARVEAAVRDATLAIEQRNDKLAQTIIDNDIVLDEQEVDIEEECLKMLALYQPVAIDLRFIIAVLKINSSFENPCKNSLHLLLFTET